MTKINLYNSMSKSVELLTPATDKLVRLYACGITAYDYAHLGNLRRYVGDDILVRSLRYQGFTVKHVQNVTDVGHLTSDADDGDDKLEKAAAKNNRQILEIVKKYEDYYWHCCEQMNITPPNMTPHATAYIPQQLKIAIALEKKGYAYLIPGDGLYFDTSKMPHYSDLAGLDLNQQQEGARVAKVAAKRNPSDFAVWKLEKPGENRQMVWPSPWGERSFPGWHLECVAMSLELLGNQFEIHTGGIDHIPVHHTNEIAQAEAYTGKHPFVRFWLHHNFMLIDGQKMSKSLGNIYRLDDVIEHGFSPMDLRYLFLTAHYRRELNFTWESLRAAATALERLVGMLYLFSQQPEPSVAQETLLVKSAQYRERFLQAINNDLDTPQALSLIHEITKANLESATKLDLIYDLDDILGLNLRQAVTAYGKKQQQLSATPAGEAAKLLSMRQEAKAAADFARADALREKLLDLGYRVIDTSEGAKLQKISS